MNYGRWGMFPSMTRMAIVTRAPEDDAGGGEDTQPGSDDAGGDDDSGSGDDDTGGDDQGGDDTQPGSGDGDTVAAGGGDDVIEEETKPKRIPWQDKRISKLTAEKGTLAAEAEALRLENAALKALGATGTGSETTTTTTTAPKTYTEAEVDQRAEEKAKFKVLDDKINGIYDVAAKADPEFKKALPAFYEATGDQLRGRVDFFEAVAGLDNGPAVVAMLVKDLDHTSELLDMSPARMGMELAKMDLKAGKGKEAVISQAGAGTRVVRPVTGAAGQKVDLADPKLSQEEFARIRGQQREKRAQERYSRG